MGCERGDTSPSMLSSYEEKILDNNNNNNKKEKENELTNLSVLEITQKKLDTRFYGAAGNSKGMLQ